MRWLGSEVRVLRSCRGDKIAGRPTCSRRSVGVPHRCHNLTCSERLFSWLSSSPYMTWQVSTPSEPPCSSKSELVAYYNLNF